VVGWEAPESFAQFIRDRHTSLLRFAHVLCGDRHLAEDLVQDALERTGLAWRRIERKDDPEGYVRRAIVNRFLNRVRALRRERLVDDPPEVSYAGPEPPDETTWRLMAGLPRAHRTVLVLRVYLDLSEAQTAGILECSVGTDKSNSSRARAKLRSAMADSAPAPSPDGGAR
jgi:RNA polymerase sigma-70 factor (sigma-E family)